MTDSQPKILGEAAYALLVRREEVNVATLLAELVHMAEKETHGQRQQQIVRAQQWLLAHRQPSASDNRSSSTLRGMSREEDSVRLPSGDHDDS